MSVEFDKLEQYYHPANKKRISVICSFNTKQLGIVQVEYKQLNNGWKMKTLPNEPSLQMLSKKEQLTIEKICRIVWRLTHETPARKDRFE